MPRRDDSVLLRDMLDAEKEAVSFVQGIQRSDLDKDRKLVLAVVRLVEIIGEAAGRLSKDFQKSHADVPWPAITGMRNRASSCVF